MSGRIKAAQLLAILTWQGEDNITQHLEDTLQVCSKALVDDEAIVREQVYSYPQVYFKQSFVFLG